MTRQLGEVVSRDEHEDMERRLAIFKQWFLKFYMKVDQQDSILIFPISDVAPSYRDTYPGVPATAVPGLRSTYLSPYIGGPELAIPSTSSLLVQKSCLTELPLVGHVEYESRISGNSEYLPVVVSMLAAPHTDLALIQLAVKSLQNSSRPTAVRSGTPRMWDYDKPIILSNLSSSVQFRRGLPELP